MTKIEGVFHTLMTFFLLWGFFHILTDEAAGFFIFAGYLAILGFLVVVAWIIRLSYLFGVHLKTRYNRWP